MSSEHDRTTFRIKNLMVSLLPEPPNENGRKTASCEVTTEYCPGNTNHGPPEPCPDGTRQPDPPCEVATCYGSTSQSAQDERLRGVEDVRHTELGQLRDLLDQALVRIDGLVDVRGRELTEPSHLERVQGYLEDALNEFRTDLD